VIGKELTTTQGRKIIPKKICECCEVEFYEKVRDFWTESIDRCADCQIAIF
jgi:hypothetical protein